MFYKTLYIQGKFVNRVLTNLFHSNWWKFWQLEGVETLWQFKQHWILRRVPLLALIPIFCLFGGTPYWGDHITFERRFWTSFFISLFDVSFGCNFLMSLWTSLLGVSFGRHFWMSLLDLMFGRHFWMSLLHSNLSKDCNYVEASSGCSLGSWTTHNRRTLQLIDWIRQYIL